MTARIIAAAALWLAAPLAAQTTPQAAIAAVQAYLDDHNRHDLVATLSHYDPQADFQLNMGRPLVKGIAAITTLERFDAIAGSTLLPFGWSAAPLKDGKGWAVSVRGVLENSRIFSALGLHIVVAVPEAPIFHLEGGKITYALQPPLQAACLAPIQQGFAAFAVWLETQASPLAPVLLNNGRLVLEPATIPAIIEQLGRWRLASGWSPAPAQLRACANLSG